jgi:hypothetical protein
VRFNGDLSYSDGKNSIGIKGEGDGMRVSGSYSHGKQTVGARLPLRR